MSERRDGSVTSLLSERGTVFEVLIVAVLVAIGINLLAASLPELLHWLAITTGCIGLTLIASGISLLVVKLYRHRNSATHIQGFFVYNVQSQELVNIPRYDYAWDLRRYDHAAFVENSALHTIWQRDPLSFKFDPEQGRPVLRDTLAGQLV